MQMRRLPAGFVGFGDAAPTPAPTPDAVSAAANTALAPITLISPMPSITAPGATQVSSTAVPSAPAGWCAIESWVNSYPGLAALAGVGLFFIVKGGRARK